MDSSTHVPHIKMPSRTKARWAMLPQNAYFSPEFIGLENIRPSEPGLLVGNHTIYGAIDSPIFVTEIFIRTGVLVRWLGDRLHFVPPVWRDLLWQFGAVEGSRANCTELMRRGEFIGVFPGGGREVAKRRGEAYQLLWKQRTGFARMAATNNYPIIPFAAVGVEECYDILYDGNDFQASWLAKTMDRTGLSQKFLRGGEMFMPLVRGLGPTAIPRPSKMYFQIGEPIYFEGDASNDDDIWAFREIVREQVEAMIADLRQRRDTQAQHPIRKLLAPIRKP